MRRIIRAFLICVVAALVYAVLVSEPPSVVRVGESMPPLEIVDAEHRRVPLSAFRGEVVLLNFWATWCPPCRHEIPSLNRLARRFANRSFRLLGVSEDADAMAFATIREFARQVPMAFPVYVDPAGAAADALSVIGLPESFLIDREGRLVRHVRGALEWDDPSVIAAIEALLSP
ncbi:MAG: TlpA family protein disulfide reductase [Deltaproteobacteria bacterium]|nr:TlpA family protein disulfide reductase [Deltaproteobacteria bacterium]